jgi:hypothetical protein
VFASQASFTCAEYPFWADKKMKLKTTRSVMRQRKEGEKRVDNPVA